MKKLVLMLVGTLFIMSGCMTSRSGNKADILLSSLNLHKKRVAVLPVRSQKPSIPDPSIPIKKELNKRIGKVVKKEVPEIDLIEQQESYETIVDAGKIGLLDQLISGYDASGAFDKKLIASLCSTLKADYILVSMLKLEQKDALVAKTFASTLELALLNDSSSEPLWDAVGNFKKYGITGVGDTENDEAAQELVDLSFGLFKRETPQAAQSTPAN